MTDLLARGTIDERADSRQRRGGAIGFACLYWRPLLALSFALPVAVNAAIRSLDWLDAPFPGFYVMSNGVIPTVSGYDWPPDPGALFHSQVVAMDGVAVNSGREVYERVAGSPVGTPFEYTFRKEGRLFRLTIPSMQFSAADYAVTCGILLGFGCLSLAVGLAIGFMQPRKAQARVYLLQAFVGGMYALTGILLHEARSPLFTDLCFVFECFYAATVVHLALVFPVERRFVGVRRVWPLVPYFLSTLLVILVLNGFRSSPPDLSAAHVAYLYIASSLAFLVLALCYAYWENREPLARPRIRTVLPGFLLGNGVIIYAFVDNALAGREFPVQFALIFTVLFYAAIAYAIVRYDLFDVDRLVRLSFVYGGLSAVVISTYALILALLNDLAPALRTENQGLLSAVFVLFLAALFDPLRRAIQSIVDRAFYRTRLDYRTTVSALSQALTSLLDLRQVVARVTGVLTDSMHLESATVCLRAGAGGPSVQWSREPGGTVGETTPDPLPGLDHLANTLESFPGEFTVASILQRIADPGTRRQVGKFLSGLRARVVLPLVLRDRATGVLVLGQKRSGLPFDTDDVELLRTLADQTAIAIQNARSYAALEELNRHLDDKVRQRTEELRASNEHLSRAYGDLKTAQAQLVQSEKMASLGQLVAGVAHELNNPASLVHGGLANLNEYLQSFVEVIRAYGRAPIADPSFEREIDMLRARAHLDALLDQTPELLQICTEGSERIRKIVDDLRIFVRADQGEFVPTDVVEGLESTIRLLGQRLSRQGIEVETDYHKVPKVEAQAGQLNQVWMNLLSNAIEAVEERPAPDIRVAARMCSEGPDPSFHDRIPYVEVEIRDNGIGIQPDDRAKIFEPFFTTKPIGRGTGLGLSIVYGAVKNHGGTIAVESEPGRGTSVVVRLPVTRRQAAAQQ